MCGYSKYIILIIINFLTFNYFIDFNFKEVKAGGKKKVQISSSPRVSSVVVTINLRETDLLGIWNMGTGNSRLRSLLRHFNRHGSEVGAQDEQQYFNKAVAYRQEILEGKLDNVRITRSYGSIPSLKYKNQVDGRFIILTDEGKEILSFGI